MSGWVTPVFESSTPLGLNTERSRSERSRSVEIRIPFQNPLKQKAVRSRTARVCVCEELTYMNPIDFFGSLVSRYHF
ncbi:hypothetical protein CKA32_006259 [Geitlerinema sp. FC II]|nr:hypothetical protein CKA32_006259 [Geitlerinema sp. FC II]